MKPGDIGFNRHQPSRHGAGPFFTFVPLSSTEALTRARLDAARFERLFPQAQADALYLYALDPEGSGIAIRHGCSRRISGSPKTQRRAAPLRPSPAC